MTKIAVQCTRRHCAALVLGNFSLLFPSFLSSCNVNPSLLLGLCLCLYNPLCLLIIVYYFLLPGFICMCCLLSLSHSFLLWYPTPDYHCSVVGPVSTVCDESWICSSCCCYLILPTFLCLVSPYFCLPSPFKFVIVVLWLFVTSIFLHFCHPSAPALLIVMSLLVAWNEQSFFPFLFPLALVLMVYSKSKGTSIRKHCFLLPDNNWTGVFFNAIFQLTQWQGEYCCHLFEGTKHQQVKQEC